MKWYDNAICKEIGSEIFFPGEGGAHRPATRICNTYCEVRQECLDAAMREEYGLGEAYRHGVRGGLGGKGRAKLAQERGERIGLHADS